MQPPSLISRSQHNGTQRDIKINELKSYPLDRSLKLLVKYQKLAAGLTSRRHQLLAGLPQICSMR
jgi:hypothetical protein